MKKILLVMSLISVLLLAGCNKNEEVNNNVNTVPEVTDNQQQLSIEETNVDDNNNETNQNKLNNLISATNVNGVSVPKINLESDDAKKANDEISQLVDEYHGITYKYNTDNNVLYLFIEQSNDFDDLHEYYAYNFDISNGNLLKNIDILGQEKANEIMNRLPDVYDGFFQEVKLANEKMMPDADWQAMNNRSNELMPKDIEDLKYYVDVNEGPQIAIRKIAIAGPEYINTIINLNDILN